MSGRKLPDLNLLPAIFRKYPEIEAVYLFGSRAAARAHSRSDLDLAILSTSSKLQEKKLDILTDLARVGFCEVDLVFPSNEDIVLQYEAVRQNRLVYARAGFDRGGTYSKIIRQYLDFHPFLLVQRQAYKDRILRG